MKLVTIVIMYSKGDGRPFLIGNTFAVSTDEDIRRAYRELAEPLIAADLTIRDQIFVVTPDELMAQACRMTTPPAPVQPSSERESE